MHDNHKLTNNEDKLFIFCVCVSLFSVGRTVNES